MKKWVKFVLVIVVANWFISAAYSVYIMNNIKTVELFEKRNPEIKVEVVNSTLSFFDVLLTRDHEWETVWLLDGEKVKIRWERTYQQPIPTGVYYALGSSTIRFLGFLDN